MPVVHKGMYWQQLDCSDAQTLQMLDEAGRRKPPERPPPARGDILALLRERFDMRFIDDGIFPRSCGSVLLAPREGFVNDDALRHAARVVAPVK